MTRLVWLGLLLGCGQVAHETVAPKPPEKPLLDRHVRVHLRSLGDWKQLTIKGKGGLWIGTKKVDAYLLKRDQPGTVVMRGDQGVVFVAKRAYSGDLLWRKGKLINNLPLENYVLGVLRGELPLKQVPVAAAAAQAIAVRSYTLHYMKLHDDVRDVDDTTLFQVYAGLQYAPDDDNLRNGVNRTARMYLEYKGQPLKCYYHSTCGGHTTDVPTGLNRLPLSPMSGVPCDACRISKYYRWTARVPEKDVLKAAGAKGPLTRVQVAAKGPGGRAKTILVNKEMVRASTFRIRLGPSKLRSTRILKVARTDGHVVFEGGGWGHGVGLCQMGSIGRAKEGWDAERIVAYYYPGAKLVR